MAEAEDAPNPAPVGGRRGRGLSRQRIVDAAIELVDEQGLGALTMRGLAGRLGVEAMSLYKHISSRDMLFDAIVERIVGELSEDDAVSREPNSGWRPYLANIAHGIRRYARAHPHAFPLVATRPTEAPWINPPLRSLEWIEAFLNGLIDEGFTDDQVLFAYRTFNGFLLGFLLLETSAMAVQAPLPGDGSYTPAEPEDREEPASAAHPVPGGLTPTRSREDRQDVSEAETDHELIDPQDQVDAGRYPTIHRLAHGLAEDHFAAEFDSGLENLLNEIAGQLDDPGDR